MAALMDVADEDVGTVWCPLGVEVDVVGRVEADDRVVSQIALGKSSRRLEFKVHVLRV